MQSLIIFEYDASVVLPSNSNSQKNKKEIDPHNISNIIILERSELLWQLYIASNLGCNGHFTAPTICLPLLIKNIKATNSKVSFTFIASSCTYYELPTFKICAFHETTIIDSVGVTFIKMISENIDIFSFSSSSRGDGGAFNVGLQTMSSHQNYLGRFCQLPHVKPIVNIGNQFTSNGKMLCLKALLHCIELCKAQFNLSYSPFSIQDFSQNYQLHRNKLREEFIDYFFDHSLKEGLSDINVDYDGMPEALSVKINSFLMYHKDYNNDSNIDYTISLSAPIRIEEITSYASKDSTEKLAKSVKWRNSFAKNGRVSVNMLLYSRKSVHSYTMKSCNIDAFLNSVDGCCLVQLCLKAILQCKIPFDYQGYLYEREEPLNNRINELLLSSKVQNNKSKDALESFCGTSCFLTAASFDKMVSDQCKVHPNIHW
jgi:hypothetical protein